MSKRNDYVDYLLEQLAPLAVLGTLKAKRMFGGHGLYLDGVMFGLVADDTLYFKADTGNQAIFDARAMPPFIYTRQGKPVTLSFRAPPAEAFDDPADLLALARLGVEAAWRKREGKPA